MFYEIAFKGNHNSVWLSYFIICCLGNNVVIDVSVFLYRINMCKIAPSNQQLLTLSFSQSCVLEERSLWF